MKLRPYQREAKDAVLDQWKKGVKRTLLVLPTGTGKTIVFASVIHEVAPQGRVLVLAHRGELLEQAAGKIKTVTGMVPGVEKAEKSAGNAAVTVGSIQTVQNRLNRFDQGYYTTIIIDEAHHALSESYRKVLNHFSEANVLGVTATPDRGDKKDLGEIFETIAYEYSMGDAIKNGYLCRIRAVTIPLKIDISKVGVAAGDYKLGEIGSALDPYLEEIADHLVEVARYRKTVVFLPLIITSQKFCRMLQARGFRAAEVNGGSKDREQVLKDFDEGKYDILCNSMLLTEGWDCPSVDCVVVLRPTKVRSLYAQMIGRGTRPFPGKQDLLIPDFLWHTARHNLCKAGSLFARNEDIEKRINDKIQNEGTGDQLDLMDLVKEAEEDQIRDAQAEREASLQAQLEANRNKKKKVIDPIDLYLSLGIPDLLNYEPVMEWEAEEPTENQLKAIRGFGIDPDKIVSKGEASQIIGRLMPRRSQGMATPRQMNTLRKYGFQNVSGWTLQQASSMISRISANRWRRPYGVDPETYDPNRKDREPGIDWDAEI